MNPLDLAWRELAEAEVEHDLHRADVALAHIRRLEQRRGEHDAVEPQPPTQ